MKKINKHIEEDQYALHSIETELEFICKKIANKEEVKLEDMIWAEKLAKAHTLARDWLQKQEDKTLKILRKELLTIFSIGWV